MVTTDKNYQLMACHYIDNQLKKLIKEINGARKAEDIEFVHQSRVASRRLRAAFDIFENCFPAKEMKKWCREIKMITKALGPARDADVQIEFLNKAISKLDTDKKSYLPGIKRLLLRTTQNRKKQQSKIIKTVDRLESKAILPDIHSSIEKILFCMIVDEPELKSDYVFAETSGHIRKALKDMVSYQRHLDDKDNISGHHKMRIAAKRLRYTMEICREPYEGKLDNVIKVVKKLQTLLGDIHDCDVWIDHIDNFIQEELKRTKEYFGNEKPYNFLNSGLEYLKQERRQVREHLFEVLVRYWKILERQNFWETLEANLDKPQSEKEKPKFAIVEITKRNLSEKANNENTSDRGYPRESAGIEGSS
ncbi:MAG: CHAD domain-containing protein [Sedimentisphaerales bacterium]|nr:CHAD domain-containing protein [Sedimentisphaerales bacterium]